MSTKATLAHHNSDEADNPSWHLYEEVFEAGVVYLELEGVSVELRTREQGGADLVVRLPIETVRQLGLHAIVQPKQWELASRSDKLAGLQRLGNSVRRFDDPTDPVSLADALAQPGDDADFEFDAPRIPPATNIVTIGIDSERAVKARLATAMKGEPQGCFITFASPELLFQTFTQPRWHIVKALTGVGPLALPELARRVGCDVEAVHEDVRALLKTGVLESTAEGAIMFPYDAMHVDFMLPAG